METTAKLEDELRAITEAQGKDTKNRKQVFRIVSIALARQLITWRRNTLVVACIFYSRN